MTTAERYHDISCGHRVFGHESKCAHLHGHNYRFHFKVLAETLDSVGRVVDFSVIKSQLCEWLEQEWDHRFLIFQDDPLASSLHNLDPQGVVLVPFNPTAENLALHIVTRIAPQRLKGTGCTLISCRVEETRKCAASFSINKTNE